jgi:hypothetical protein
MRWIICFGLFYYCLSVYSQKTDSRNLVFETKWFNGELTKPDTHTQAVLQSGAVNMYEIRAGYRDYDSSYFAVNSRYPVFGLGLSAIDFSRARMIDEPRRLGNLYSIFAYIDRNLLQYKSFSAGYNFDAGFAYNTDVYDSITNANKIFSSSPFMVYIGIGLNVKFRLSNHWETSASIGAKHYSNGKIGIWNKGMNILGSEISLRYYLSEYENKYPQKFRTDFKPHFYWHLSAGGGALTYLEDLMLDNFVASNRQYSIYAKYFIAADAMYRFSPKYGAGVGWDLFYIPSLQSFQKIDERRLSRQVFEATKYNPFSSGIAVTQELFYRQLAVNASIGYYLYRKIGQRTDESPLYERAGFRYYFPTRHKIFVGISIKAHQFKKAEYFEFSVGKAGNF